MDRTWPITEIEYPDGDGQPMAETPLHGRWMMRLLNLFERRYRKAALGYIASNLMVYYTKGDPRDSFAPDLIVLLASDRHERNVLKLWEEPEPPNLVVEVTSKSTRRRDYRWKMKLYAALAISEYVLYDPTSDYLSPPLQAYRRSAMGVYEPILPDDRQRLCSEQTGVAFSLDEHGQLLLEDIETGDVLLTDFEAEQKARRRERLARKREQQAKLQEQTRRTDAERRRVEAENRVADAERQAEAARLAQEAEREAKEAERQARLLAEARNAKLEAELARLRGQEEA